MLTSAINPRLLLFVLLATLVSYSRSILAEQVSGLYEVTLPIASQSKQELRKATQEGLGTVFVRVSGSEGVLNQGQIGTAIKRAHAYLKQFRYERLDLVDGKQQLFVSLEFEPEQVDKLLREAGLPLWSSNRPTVLVWMVVEDRKSRRFVSSDTDPHVIKAINEHAMRRGLIIKMPLLDLEDNLSLSSNQLWKLNSRKILLASKRYGADTVLVGRASHLSNGQWLGAWLYHFNDQRISIDGEGESIDSYIGAGFNNVADLLAADYAITPISITDGGLLMRLSGIRNFADYAQAMNYLENVAAIRYANVIEIQGDEIIVRLKAEGLLEQLQRSLALDNRLQPLLAQPYQGVHDISLDYQWLQADGRR